MGKYVSLALTGDYIRETIEARLGESLGEKIFAYPWWLVVATPLVATAVTTVASVIPARQAAVTRHIRIQDGGEFPRRSIIHRHAFSGSKGIPYVIAKSPG